MMLSWCAARPISSHLSSSPRRRPGSMPEPARWRMNGPRLSPGFRRGDGWGGVRLMEPNSSSSSGEPQPIPADDQSEAIAFLSRRQSYGADAGPVQRIETHASLVFLAGDRAYKLKRAVRFSYLDYSTAALREAACRAELALNRRTAPELYLEVRPLGRAASGGLAFDATPAVDWVLVMRRFDQAALF